MHSITFSWKMLPSMDGPRHNFALIWLPQGDIIAFSGCNSMDYRQKVEALRRNWYHPADCTPEEDREGDDESMTKWRKLAKIPEALNTPTAAYFQGRVFVVGGWVSEYKNSRCVYAMTPPTRDEPLGQWVQLHGLQAEGRGAASQLVPPGRLHPGRG